MDKIWDRKSFEVGSHWPLWRGLKKTNNHAEPTKVERLKNIKNKNKCPVIQYMKKLHIPLPIGSMSYIEILKLFKL